MSHCEDDVKDFIKSTTCFRVSSLLPFDHQIQPLKPCHNCCSICKKECPCDICPASELPFECIPGGGADVGKSYAVRSISNEDREDVKNALKELFWGIINRHDNSEAQFYMHLISDIVDNCHTIFTVEDIITNYPVFSMKRALKILEIFDELFGDISELPSYTALETIDDVLDTSILQSTPSTIGNCDQSSSSDSDSNGNENVLL